MHMKDSAMIMQRETTSAVFETFSKWGLVLKKRICSQNEPLIQSPNILILTGSLNRRLQSQNKAFSFIESSSNKKEVKYYHEKLFPLKVDPFP